jgi:hypothetical protein
MPALRLRKLALAAAATVCALAALYILAGFLLVAKWVKSEAPKALAATGHQLRLGDLAFNPITLTARGTDIAIDDAILSGNPCSSAPSCCPRRRSINRWCMPSSTNMGSSISPH